MTVLDTHAWIWWVIHDRRLSPRAREAIAADADRHIATMSVWEVATLARQHRLRLALDVKTWVARALGGSGVAPVPLSPEIALAAGSLPDDFPGDPADRIVYATAVATGARLVTKDRRLRTWDAARTVW